MPKAPPRKKRRQEVGLTLDKRAVRAYLLAMAKTLDSPDRPAAVIYARVSSRRQAEEGGSLEAQLEACARHAVLSGLEVVDTFTDGGISGGKDETRRPGLALALEAVRSGRASVLVVRHADRLSRDSDLAGHLRVEVKRAGGRLEVVDEAKNDPIRLAVDKMLAELERIRGSQRMKTFHATRKAKGLHAGPAPFGFQKGPDGRLERDAERWPVVERILSARAEGRSLRDVAALLEAEGLPAPKGGAWSAQTVANIARAALAGA